MFWENFCLGIMESSEISDENLRAFQTVPAQFSTFFSRFNIFMRKCPTDVRESAPGLPYLILLDIICFVFIAHFKKKYFWILSKGGLISSHHVRAIFTKIAKVFDWTTKVVLGLLISSLIKIFFQTSGKYMCRNLWS